MIRKAGLLLVAVVAAIFFAGSAAWAGSASTAFGVTMAVTAHCKIATSATFAFSDYDPVITNATSPLDVAASNFITVNCTKKTTGAWVGLDVGTHSANAPGGSTRAARGGTNSDYAGYDFYQDSGYTTLWGNTQPSSPILPVFTSAVTPAQLTVYGKVPAGQDVSIDSYADTITATINF